MRIVLAWRLFWAALWDERVAKKLAVALESPQQPATVSTAGAAQPQPAAAGVSARSDALTLLAALQREARFLDLVKEPLAQYSDEQIGAAARDVLSQTARVLDRMFGIEPLTELAEGQRTEIPSVYDPFQIRISGQVTGSGPWRAKVVHPGWRATRCQVPSWSGNAESQQVLAPMEVELE